MLDEVDHDFASDEDASWGGAADGGKDKRDSLKDIVSQAIAESEKNAKEMSSEDVEKIIEQIDQGKSIAEIQNIGEESLEALYAFGYGFYKAARFEEAMEFFKHLAMLNHMDKRYYFGVAGCLQGLKRFAEAIDVYSLLFLIDEQDPQITYNAGICSLALGDLENAHAAFDLTVELVAVHSADKPELVKLGDRAAGLLANVESRMAAKTKSKK